MHSSHASSHDHDPSRHSSMADDGATRARASNNPRSSAVRRIAREIRECVDAASADDAFVASPLEDDIFEWQFAVLGAPDSAFEGGIYHGRITLPPTYPFAPPTFVMRTANGRFEVNAKICLSISGHHPNTWLPSWGVRSALTALRAFMPTAAEGAVGSLDWSDERRRELARVAGEAREVTYEDGNEARRALSARLHEQMLERRERVMANERGRAGTSGGGGEIDHGAREESVEEDGEVVDAETPIDAPAREETERVPSDVSSASSSQSSDSNDVSDTNDASQDTSETFEFRQSLLDRLDLEEREAREESDDPPRPVTPPDDTERLARRREELAKTKAQLDSTARALFAVIVGIYVKRLLVSFVITALES